MEKKENFLPPSSLQRLTEGTNNMSKCFVQQSEHMEWAGKESVAISWGKVVKCLPALRHKYHGVKYRDNATGDRLLSSRRLQQPQYPPIHQNSSNPADGTTTFSRNVGKHLPSDTASCTILCVTNFILSSPANCPCLSFCPVYTPGINWIFSLYFFFCFVF